MAGSTVSRRAFGKFLAELRSNAGKAPLASALSIEVSKMTLHRLENGVPTRITTPSLERLLEFYEVSSETRAEALTLWREVQEQAKAARLQGNSGSWKEYADQFDSHFPHYLRLEGDTHHLTTHQLVLIPGLLQTPDYKRAIVRIDEPDLSAVNLERRVELVERRQTRLHDAGFRMDAFLSEAALRHQPADGPVMFDQMQWLASIGQRENVSIRVVPFSAKAHRGLTIQSFTLLEFPELSRGLVEPPVVYFEGAYGAGYHERDDVIDGYRHAISALEAVALTEEDTLDMVLRTAKEHAT